MFFVFLLLLLHSQKLFANRDYVFNRRYFVDSSRKLIIIVNKSTQHPAIPKKPNNQRVEDYWSYMAIRCTSSSFKNPGLEYVLTYFDNPGIVLPPAVTSWVAQKQMPEFLNKLYMATLEYAKERRKHECENTNRVSQLSIETRRSQIADFENRLLINQLWFVFFLLLIITAKSLGTYTWPRLWISTRSRHRIRQERW